MTNDFWSDADIIDIYTRRQALEDGVLVQLSGPGYQGDPWVPAMVAEAGFRYPNNQQILGVLPVSVKKLCSGTALRVGFVQGCVILG
jgi:hypothetical protein